MSKELFLKNLESFGLGDLLRDAGDEQMKVVDAVKATFLQGKLTIELTYSPKGRNGIKVSSKVTAKIPKTPLESVEMFVPDDECNLYEENPAQMNFDNVKQMKPDKKIKM